MPTDAEPHSRTGIPPASAEAAAAVLASRRLPRDAATAAAVACRAGAAGVPVLLAMPAAAGRLLLARALHALSGRAGPLVAVSGPDPSLDGFPPGATVYLDAGALAPGSALALEALIDDGDVWVIAGLEPGSHLSPSLEARLATVALHVPPLATRLDELPALVEDIVARLAARMARVTPTLAPDALARLAAHAWPGDLTELEAVLGRAMLLAGGDRLEAGHLALEEAVAPVPAPPAPIAGAASGSELEFVLAELAHELRNPMVTIKTFARHLPSLLEDAELRERFATLTDEAIERMDGLLENVLAFARLGPPRPEPVEVAALLGRVVAEMEPELAGRALSVRQDAAAAARCAADPAHLAYALRNLFAGVAREVPAHEQLQLQATANGVVTLRFAGGAEAAERLRRLAAPGEGGSLADPALLPIAFRLARAVLARNGGALAVVPEVSGATSVVIRLPAAPAEEVV